MVACLDARATTQGAHVSSSSSVERRPPLSSAPPTSSCSARLAAVRVTGDGRPASMSAAAVAAASRQRLRYTASAAVSRQESRRRLATSTEAGSPITGARGVTAGSATVTPSRRPGAHRELRSALQQQVAVEPARRSRALPPVAHTQPPRTSRPLLSTTTKSTSTSTQASHHKLAFSRSSTKTLVASSSGVVSTASSPSRAAARLPLYLRSRQQTLLHSANPPSTVSRQQNARANTRQQVSLTSSKFSLNSSTSSLTLASVKRARKAPSPAGRAHGPPRRASGSLAELSSNVHHGCSAATGGQHSSRRAHHRESTLALAASSSHRRPRSSHRRQSFAHDTRHQPYVVGDPVAQYLQSTLQTANTGTTNRAKSAASCHLETTTATSCCGSARQAAANGCAGRDSGTQPLFCCGESGDSLALEKSLRYLQSPPDVEALIEKQHTFGERRASFEATLGEAGGHIASAAMCSNASKEHENLPATTKTNSKSKPLALNQQQQQTKPQSQQVKRQQATSTTTNNNFLLSHGMPEQLENQPPVNVELDVEPSQEDNADKMSLGSPLVTPPPCELSQLEDPPTICRLSSQPPVLAILTNPITDIYDLEPKPFARGKFAQVRRCVHRLTKQCFAAKCIKKRRRSLDTRHEILLEIEALKLSYFTERIVKLYEVYETPSEMILVLELAKGGELQRVLDEEERIVESSAQQMVAQILDGLIHLHDNEIAHLDIKPQNLLLTDIYPLGDIKLCDFGISRRITKDCEIRDICGTPDYVAPEILRYDPINLSTDMWSLGVLTYILLSGYSPFGSDNKQQTFCNITQAELDFPSEIFDKISPEAIDFMKKLIIREPSQRLTSRQARNHAWLVGQEPT